MNLPSLNWSSHKIRARLTSSKQAAGVTLVEILIALTMTLVIMGAVLTLFGNVGNAVNNTRSAIEMGDRVRTATFRLRQDLQNATVTPNPPRRPEMGEGYLEYFEGRETDWQKWNGSALVPKSAPSEREWGDTDDILALTIRSTDEPFSTIATVGFTTHVVESSIAEVVWFVATNTQANRTTLNLHRRQFLVAPHATHLFLETTSGNDYLDLSILSPAEQVTRINDFRNYFDISHRIEGDRIVLNTLGDLTKRENRTMRTNAIVNALPTPSNPWNVELTNNGVYQPFTGYRQGEDLMLTDLMAFDVQIFDPSAQPRLNSSSFVTPDQPGFWSATSTPGSGSPRGAYVDLGYAFNQVTRASSPLTALPASHFSGRGNTLSNLTTTYDTYSYHYEVDGVDQDGDSRIDEGTNPFNSSGVFVGTAPETAPPYAHPLRALQVKVRVYEPDSRQVRQVTVNNSFVPK